MAKHAWSDILGAKKAIKVGDTVSPGDFEDKDEYDNLCDIGILRDREPPKTKATESPREAVLRDFAEVMERARDEGMENFPDILSETDIAASFRDTPTSKDAVEVGGKGK